MTLRPLHSLASACALVLMLATATAARADHGRPLLDERLAAYSAVAQAHWGGELPSCVMNGSELVPAHAVLYDHPDPTVAAEADQPGCRLWIDRDHWTRAPAGEMCTIIAHEWGHLLGHRHVSRPFALMAEFPQVTLPGCRQRSAGAGRRARAARSCAPRSQRLRSLACFRRLPG